MADRFGKRAHPFDLPYPPEPRGMPPFEERCEIVLNYLERHAKTAVDRGAALLDREFPGWRDRALTAIREHRFTWGNIYRCPLGLAALQPDDPPERYWSELARLMRDYPREPGAWGPDIELGFAKSGYASLHGLDGTEILIRAWKAVLGCPVDGRPAKLHEKSTLRAVEVWKDKDGWAYSLNIYRELWRMGSRLGAEARLQKLVDEGALERRGEAGPYDFPDYRRPPEVNHG